MQWAVLVFTNAGGGYPAYQLVFTANAPADLKAQVQDVVPPREWRDVTRIVVARVDQMNQVYP